MLATKFGEAGTDTTYTKRFDQRLTGGTTSLVLNFLVLMSYFSLMLLLKRELIQCWPDLLELPIPHPNTQKENKESVMWGYTSWTPKYAILSLGVIAIKKFTFQKFIMDWFTKIEELETIVHNLRAARN